ncbi:MAG TPA: DUF3391 domain-containing protein [Candidatus Paceibacterota bacterium]|nr:DUF3391 domain-containing protein [Candidatus Paceibacterota bacterium]
MPKVKVEQLQPGMIVAGDVKNMDNMLLIPSGAALSERQIDILSAWGVTEIEVEATAETEVSSDPIESIAPEVLARAKEEIKALFWKPDETSPVYQQVFDLMLRRRVLKQSRY